MAESVHRMKSLDRRSVKDKRTGLARALYEYFVEALQKLLPHTVQTGEFAAHMEVELVNDGPVTLLIDTTGRHFGD